MYWLVLKWVRVGWRIKFSFCFNFLYCSVKIVEYLMKFLIFDDGYFKFCNVGVYLVIVFE